MEKSMVSHQNWWQLSSIQIGGAICLPVIMLGHTLSQAYGFKSAVICILLGNAILLALGLISSNMSIESRKATPQNAQDYFGEKGEYFFALTMTLSLLGWFAIQLNMMSLSVLDLIMAGSIESSWLLILNIILGFLTLYIALYGIRGINMLADISMPLLIATLGYAWYSLESKPTLHEPPLSFGGVSMVIAMAIAVVIDLPTYFRHARSSKDGWISMVIIFGVVQPILEIIGVYIASESIGGTILDVLKRHNGHLWNIWVALFLILAGWTTNNLNIYSGVVCLKSILKNASDRTLTILFGGCGTLLACFNLLNHLEFVLDCMGILLTSMGTVIITRYAIGKFIRKEVSKYDYPYHVFAWIMGLALGFLSLSGISLTYIPVLDATIGACLGTFAILTQKGYEKVYVG